MLFFIDGREGIMMRKTTCLLLVLLGICLSAVATRSVVSSLQNSKNLDGIVMLRNPAGEITFRMESLTIMKYQGGAIRFLMKNGGRAIIVQGKHGNIVQIERP